MCKAWPCFIVSLSVTTGDDRSTHYFFSLFHRWKFVQIVNNKFVRIYWRRCRGQNRLILEIEMSTADKYCVITLTHQISSVQFILKRVWLFPKDWILNPYDCVDARLLVCCECLWSHNKSLRALTCWITARELSRLCVNS